MRNFLTRVWNRVFQWIGVQTVQHCQVLNHYEQFGLWFWGRRNKRLRRVVAYNVLDFVDARKQCHIPGQDNINSAWIVESIKCISWFWFRNKIPYASGFSYINWSKNVAECINLSTLLWTLLVPAHFVTTLFHTINLLLKKMSEVGLFTLTYLQIALLRCSSCK